MSKVEEKFEELLKENGFNVLGVKEFNAKTDYLIEKDGVECTYAIHHIDNKLSRGKQCFKAFIDYHNINVEYNKLKKEIEMKG